MQLSELRDRVSALPALENRMELIRKEIQRAEDEVSGLLRQYEKESRDMERIRTESLSSFLFKLVGIYEDKLEKEQREEIDAKLAYDRAAMRLEGLVRDKDAFAARISALRADERTYQAELANRRREIADMLTKPAGIQYAELESERNTVISQITEIQEALGAAARAKSTAENALESLGKAQGWATYDAFARGGIISHMAKYSHLDSAEQDFNILSSELRNLKSELADVHGLTVSGLSEISSVQRAVDFWFDNIFTDLSVRGQIKGNAEEISRLVSNINKAESALNSKLSKEKAALAENKRREEELLLSLR